MSSCGGIEVSVVLPTRDRWEMTTQALASALAQLDVALEVCVVDDGSAERAPAAFADDPRVRLFRHEAPAGVARSRNRAIREARGRWIAFLDDDDLWAPWHLRDLLRAAREQRARWAFSRYVMTNAERAPLGNGPVFDSDHFERESMQVNPIGTPSCVLVATEMVRAAGGFDEHLALMADWDLWIRLAAVAPPASASTVSVGYTQHPGNLSLDRDLALVERAYIAARHRPTLARLGLRFADSDHFWRWMAGGYLHARRHWPAARGYLKAAAAGRHGRDVVRAVAAIPMLGRPIRAMFVVYYRARARSRSRMRPAAEHAWLERFRDEARDRSEIAADIAVMRGSRGRRADSRDAYDS